MATDAEPRGSITAVSYNIHSSTGRDGSIAPARILGVIADTGASIVGLQEVDARTGKPGALDQFRYFAEHSGMHSIAGPNIVDHRGEYGNALLTSWTIETSRLVRLGVRSYEPRGAIVAILRCGSTRLQVVNTHLGLRPAERREQVRRLAAEVGDFGGPTLFMGDFNVWRRRSSLLASIGAPLGGTAVPLSFPAARPLFALDRVWSRPAGIVESVRSVRSAQTRAASDHLPLVASLRLD
jgi:endonuclease/exonuclease/phosphatase family metal-dependent hydrolase